MISFPFGLALKIFKTRLLGRGFHTLIKSVSFSSPTDVGSHNPPPLESSVLASTRFFSPINVGPHQIHLFLFPIDVRTPPNPPPSGLSVLADTLPHVHPLRGSASSMAHSPVSGFDIICNSSNPLLANIVLFGLSRSGFSLKFLKRVY